MVLDEPLNQKLVDLLPTLLGHSGPPLACHDAARALNLNINALYTVQSPEGGEIHRLNGVPILGEGTLYHLFGAMVDFCI